MYLFYILKNNLYLFLIILSMIILFIIIFILYKLIKNKIFINKLKGLIYDEENKNFLLKYFNEKYTDYKLYKKSKKIEEIAVKYDLKLIKLLKMDDIWINYLIKKNNITDYYRILKYNFDKGLFKCFLISLNDKKYADILKKWMEKKFDTFFMKYIALAGNGENFNGDRAFAIYNDKIDEIREISGDQEWQVRFFSIKILLNDKNTKSIRAIWESINDPNPQIRITIINELNSDEPERLYNQLFNLVLNDPIFDVRNAAWTRIHTEFSNYYNIKKLKLSDEQTIHLLQLLRTNVIDDENFAFNYINDSNLEKRFYAAKYLDKNKSLLKLCLNVSLGDKESLERNFNILKHATEVNALSFLSVINTTNNPASLLICSKILHSHGNRIYIKNLAKKVFSIFSDNIYLKELYESTLKCLHSRGDDEALKILKDELIKRKNNEEISNLIFRYIPSRGDEIFLDILFEIFINNDYKSLDELRKLLLKMPESIILEKILHIILSIDNKCSEKTKIESLKLLGEMNKQYCVQLILENLSSLSLEDTIKYTKILANYQNEIFKNKVEWLLNSADSKLRAKLISSLPETGIKDFLPIIKSGIKDPDPDVRISCVWSLIGYKDNKSYISVISLLRDPLERVRVEVSKAIGEHGTSEILEELKKILKDENEVNSVKIAAITGISKSKNLKSIEVLTDRMEKENDNELEKELIKALSNKKDKNEIILIIKIFKQAIPKLKKAITESFKIMGDIGEELLIDLLKEKNISLHNYIAEILEHSGFIESRIRKLSYRDPAVRRETAEILSLIGTKTAYRGIVLAARDPDEEVRVKVIKALEKLGTKDCTDILDSLKLDPDLRVRKYTLWALERLEANNL
ncbi:MAG: HEAT repeat domain-containing protein [Spirochaetes bacterium]|nr:HEAT repeat domain-containing protein [Spirochaetota bacterium]